MGFEGRYKGYVVVYPLCLHLIQGRGETHGLVP
jgi:hypothetical protein